MSRPAAAIARRFDSLAWPVAALLTLLPPALYYSRESAALAAEIEASLEWQTLAITRVVDRYPESWRFHDNLLGELLAFSPRTSGEGAAARVTRVLGDTGEVVIAGGEAPPAPRITKRSALLDSGTTVGHVEQQGSLRPVLWVTLMVAQGSSVIALMVFLVLKWIPRRGIGGAIDDGRRASAVAGTVPDEQSGAELRLSAENQTLKRQARLDGLLGRLAEVANEARDLRDALNECLMLVCEFTGWAIGHAALVRRDGDFAATTLNVWYSNAPERYAKFIDENDHYRFPLRVGLFATRVLTTRRPVWVRDLAARNSFGRLGFLQEAGLVSGVALPITVSGELPGLIEYFTSEPVAHDPELLSALERASVYIGRVIERQRAEEEIRRLNNELEGRVAARTTELERSNRVLEERNRESAQVTEMSNMLQTAADMPEAAEILSRMMGPLLAPHGGAIYLTSRSLNRLDRLAYWGEAPFAAVIGPDDCWGVRRGRSYSAFDPERNVFCRHVHEDARRQPYMCVPMMAQSTSLGMLHVAFVADAGCADVQVSEVTRVQRLADQAAMALANLKLRRTLREQSIRDTLTGLYNRRYLEEALEREVSRATREGKALAVLMLDVDHFKRYNDQFGHEGGDALLRAFGRLLREMVRTSDVAARYGGEEFTALLYNAPLADAREWGPRLREAVQKLDVKSDGRVLPPVSISLGLALFPEHGTSSEALLKAADGALYDAKNTGRDRVIVAGRAGAIASTAAALECSLSASVASRCDEGLASSSPDACR